MTTPEITLLMDYTRDPDDLDPFDLDFVDVYVVYPISSPNFPAFVLNIEADLNDDPHKWNLYTMWGGPIDETIELDTQLGYVVSEEELEAILNYPITEWKWNV